MARRSHSRAARLLMSRAAPSMTTISWMLRRGVGSPRITADHTDDDRAAAPALGGARRPARTVGRARLTIATGASRAFLTIVTSSSVTKDVTDIIITIAYTVTS